MFSYVALFVQHGPSAKGNAGFPQGGSLGLAKSIEQRYLALGGQISYGVKATKILVQEGRATGVQLKNKNVFTPIM